MKNAISNIWLIGLVTLFIFVFSGYLAITISYSSAFKMKNQVLSIIEKHKDMDSQRPSACAGGGGKYCNAGTLQSINAYLHAMGYKVRGKCPSSVRGTPGELWYGVSELKYDGDVTVNTIGFSGDNNKYYYCYMESPVPHAGGKNLRGRYYKVLLFYKMDLPVLGDLFTFEVPGTTDEIYG